MDDQLPLSYYLIQDQEEDGESERRILWEIVRIDVNPFVINSDVHHNWELRLQGQSRWIGDEWENIGDPLLFKITKNERHPEKPTIEEFSEFMRSELWNTIDAMEIDFSEERYFDNDMFNKNLNDITLEHVYSYLKNAFSKKYEKTSEFIKDFNHYQYRIYSNLKFCLALHVGYFNMFSHNHEETKIGFDRFYAFMHEIELSDELL